MKVSIIGAGAFGQALGKILTDNQHRISYYDPQLFPDVNLDAATYQADVIVIAIPSAFVPDFVASYPDRLKKIPTICATKGLLSADAFAEFTQFSAISGPGFAQEIIDGKPCTLTASAPFAMGLLQNDQITIELHEDLAGILLCGSLKNIYAIGAGYHSESASDIAMFIQHAHYEMKKYLADHGADSETAECACGLGDLILTCSNDASRNYTCGKRLREGNIISEIVNELKTIEGLSALEKVDTDNYMVLREIKDLVNHSQQ